MHADPGVAAEIAVVLAEPAERLKAVVAPLAPHLREPLTVETAHDLLLALSMLEVYRELRVRGWSDTQYQASSRRHLGAGGENGPPSAA